VGHTPSETFRQLAAEGAEHFTPARLPLVVFGRQN
jgi:hypothetical protein